MSVKTRPKSSRKSSVESEREQTSPAKKVLLCAAAVIFAGMPLFAGTPEESRALVAVTSVLLVGLGVCLTGAREGGFSGRGGAGVNPAPTVLFAIVGWLIVNMLATLTSVNLHASFIALATFLAYICAYLIGRSAARSSLQTSLLLAGASGGAFIASTWGVRSYLINLTALNDPSWRTFGTFHNPNAFAGFLLTTVPAAWVLVALQRSAIIRGCAVIVGSICLIALFLTGSRGGFLGAVCAVLATVTLMLAKRRQQAGVPPQNRRTGKSQRRRWEALIICLAVAAVVVMAVSFPPLRLRLAGVFKESHSAAFRVLTWRSTIDMASDRPLLGWGPGSFESVYPRFARAGFTKSPHNDFLAMLSEGGVGAFLMFLAIFVCFFAKSVSSINRCSPWQRPVVIGGFAAVVGFCVHGLVDSNFRIVPTASILFLWMGLARESRWQVPLVGSRGSRVSSLNRIALLGASVLIILAAVYSGFSAVAAASVSKAGATAEQAADLEVLTRATRLSPLDSKTHRALARGLLAGAKDPYYLSKAEREAEKAISLQPTGYSNYVLLGEIRRARGDAEGGIATIRKAVELYPGFLRGRLLLAELFYEIKRPQEARRELETLVRLHRRLSALPQAVPGLIELDYPKAMLYLARDDLAGRRVSSARSRVEDAIREIALYNNSTAVEILIRSGQEPKGLELPLKGAAFSLSARLRELEGNAEAAHELAKKAEKISPDADWESFLNGGLIP